MSTVTAVDHLSVYAEGWANADPERILEAASPGFVFDDPNAGRIQRADFASYLEATREAVETLRTSASSTTWMEIGEVVTKEEDGVLTAWCWWAIPGTGVEGSGLIKVGAEGVVSERIAYYTALPA